MNSLSMNRAIHSAFPDPDLAVETLRLVGDAAAVIRAFQRDTINALADCLVNCAARIEAKNSLVTCEDLKREAQALRDYADTLAPSAPEVNR